MASRDLPWRALAAPLAADERARLASSLRRVLAWDGTGRAPRVWAPDATPFVSLYRRGALRGCVGADEGEPAARLHAAFTRALGDPRFGGISVEDRGELAAQVSYLVAPRRMRWEDVDALEPGTHGVAVVAAAGQGASALLLPQVARDHGLDGRALLTQLARKAQLDARALERVVLHRFTTDDVTAHEDARSARDPIALAAAWLAARVDDAGAMCFSLDARRGQAQAAGAMVHARVAVALRALERAGGHARALARGRAHLASEIRRALDGKSVAGWPDHPSPVAGTLALAVRAGIPVERELAELARHELAGASPWHAAQSCLVLGAAAPPRLWRACVDDLARKPWAPWTAMAARTVEDGDTRARVEAALLDSIRDRAPHVGGADTTPIPELALTAIAVEALVDVRGSAARAAVRRAREFLHRWQLLPGAIPAALDPALATGAFPASPVVDFLRVDITGHALLAIADENDAIASKSSDGAPARARRRTTK